MTVPKFSPASPNHAGDGSPPKDGHQSFGNGVGQSARPEGDLPVTFYDYECDGCGSEATATSLTGQPQCGCGALLCEDCTRCDYCAENWPTVSWRRKGAS